MTDNELSLPRLKAIGERLRWVRIQGKASQAELCRLMNVTQSTWSKWEAGIRMPDPVVMMQFAARAKVSLDLIYRGMPVGIHQSLRQLLEIEAPHLLATSPTDTDRDRDTALASYRKAIGRENRGQPAGVS